MIAMKLLSVVIGMNPLSVEVGVNFLSVVIAMRRRSYDPLCNRD